MSIAMAFADFFVARKTARESAALHTAFLKRQITAQAGKIKRRSGWSPKRR
ncbi:hypothetical protein [Hyphomicrobium sulfonivorans]|uniref:hypothetical protein n=1 Tax=Hyphomicrobium sulfonivorans TaxID=121290 RepID=UPI001570D17E|nr:hypothetical protein [Hyphomicrobium sulfonivorans]MBI1650500.1 hypothetical protein [Hyphomicrobium sulfonivorans]